MTGHPASAPPVPEPDELTAPYWDGARKGKLCVQRCLQCDTFQHFPAPVCSTCGSFDLNWELVSGKGIIYSYTVVWHPLMPQFADLVPYVCAWIELPEQPNLRVLANILESDGSNIEIGMAVEVDFVERGSFKLPQFRSVPLGGAPRSLGT